MNRYIRNIQLDGFGEEAQTRLAEATVAIVGCGALGSVVAMYLAAAGVGRLRIADFDNVDLTNLQRQIFYKESEVGQPKAHLLDERIGGLNSQVEVEIFDRLITANSAGDFFSSVAVIAECSDNPATKELTVSAARERSIPVIVGGVNQYQGQVAVLCTTAPRYSDIFPAPACSAILPCSAQGVFSPVPGIVASLQASEILKIIAGLNPSPQQNILLTIDTIPLTIQKFTF